MTKGELLKALQDIELPESTEVIVSIASGDEEVSTYNYEISDVVKKESQIILCVWG